MKRLFVAIFCLFVFNSLMAQNCVSYFPTSETSRWQIDIFNEKDNKCETVTGKVLSKESKEGILQIKVENTSYNLDNSVKDKYVYTYMCKNNLFFIDIKSLLDPKTFNEYKEFDLAITGDSIELPPNMMSGQSLKDFTIKLSFTNRGINVFSCTLKSLNRKVAAVESVTTSAGTFECAKVTYTLENATYLKTQTIVTEWWAAETGLVKSTVFNLKKKQVSRTELKKFKN
jgi:hypothetical protein